MSISPPPVIATSTTTPAITTTLTLTSTTTTTATVTTPSTSKRAYTRRSTALGQFYMNRTEQEEAAIDKISCARQEAADSEKKLNDVLLRTAEAEEKSKKEIWKIKKKKAIKEKKLVDIKEKTLKAQYLTALIERNVAMIAKFNQVTGKSLPLPTLPDMDD